MWSVSSTNQVSQHNEPVSFQLTEFTERTLFAFEKAVQKAEMNGQPYFPMRIQSDGGRASILFGMMSIMKEARKRGMLFASVVTGSAYSAGGCIFMYSDLRYMGEFSNIILHSIQMSAEGALPNVMAQVKEAAFDNDRMFEVISLHLKKNKNWIKNQLKKNGVDDWCITSQQAVELGIIEKVHIPSFNLDLISQFSIQ